MPIRIFWGKPDPDPSKIELGPYPHHSQKEDSGRSQLRRGGSKLRRGGSKWSHGGTVGMPLVADLHHWDPDPL